MMQPLQSAARIGWAGLVASIMLLSGATGSAVAQGGGSVGGGMMDGNWGMFGGWGFLWFLLLIGLIVLAVSVASGNGGTQTGGQQDRAHEELRKQYARGKLSDEEFEKRRRKL